MHKNKLLIIEDKIKTFLDIKNLNKFYPVGFQAISRKSFRQKDNNDNWKSGSTQRNEELKKWQMCA